MPDSHQAPRHLPGNELALPTVSTAKSDGFGLPEALGIAMGLMWAVAVALIALSSPLPEGAGLGVIVLTVLGIILPFAVMALLVAAVRQRRLREAETAALRAALDTAKSAYAAAAARQTADSARPEKTETQLVRFASRREPATADKAEPSAAADTEEQPALALGTASEDAPVPVPAADLIRALNFPESPDDAEGFRALRRALENRPVAKVIRASQDVLTLLSQDGIFMDDLTPERARVELWRRFAQGERGRAMAVLGGVRDRSSLALTAANMRQDAVFRDAAHHFIRQFDKTLSDFERSATDQELADFAATRTAKAFMLLGRVTGIFE